MAADAIADRLARSSSIRALYLRKNKAKETPKRRERNVCGPTDNGPKRVPAALKLTGIGIIRKLLNLGSGAAPRRACQMRKRASWERTTDRDRHQQGDEQVGPTRHRSGCENSDGFLRVVMKKAGMTFVTKTTKASAADHSGDKN